MTWARSGALSNTRSAAYQIPGPEAGGRGGGLLKMPYELRLFESQIVLRSDDAATFDKDFLGGVFFVRNKVLMTKRKEKITLSHTHTNLIQHNPSRSV